MFANTSNAVSSSINYGLHDFWEENGDPRVAHYPMMASGPWPVLATIAVYLYFVKVWGPEIMRDRKPFDLRGLIRIYNLAMVLMNGWFFYEGCLLLNFGLDTWGCPHVDPTSQHPKDLRKVYMGWCFLVSKLIELLDTIFFVLRKKSSQISTLHVFHHSAVPVVVWVAFKFVPGGNNGFFPYINSGIHTIMYTYYWLSTFGPRMAPYLRWKKYLTAVQMAQFVALIVQSLQAMLRPGCQFPTALLYMTISNAFIFLILFFSFYRQSYTSSKSDITMTKKLRASPEPDDRTCLRRGHPVRAKAC